MQQAGGPEPARNTAGSTDRLDQETGPALTVASDGNDSLLSIGAAIILGLAATATWLALLLWVLRQRARRANASVGGE